MQILPQGGAAATAIGGGGLVIPPAAAGAAGGCYIRHHEGQPKVMAGGQRCLPVQGGEQGHGRSSAEGT